ncbi:MAG: 30S ribosomal protein S3 [Pseudomonadota bacterium]
MGQKVNPIGLRLGINRASDSRWYADSADFGRLLHEDLAIEKHIKKQLSQANISRIVIERPHKKCLVTIHTARPGLVIGKKGADIENMRKQLSKMTDDEVRVNLVEIRKPEIDATLVAEDIARQLERRGSFRRAMKRSIQNAMRLGAEGIKIMVSGRLGGAEIARTEQYSEGSVPLHTLRADIDYGTAEALTTYGIIGIKIWIYKGEIMEHDPLARERRREDSGEARARSSNNRGPASGAPAGA